MPMVSVSGQVKGSNIIREVDDKLGGSVSNPFVNLQ